MKRFLFTTGILAILIGQNSYAKELTVHFKNLKGTSCYSTAPVGCNEDKVADTKATYFKDAKGEEKLLYQSMEYLAFPSPANGSMSFAAVEASEDKGWAVMELITLDLVNDKVSIVGARSNSVYSKPVYQLFGDIETEK